MMLLQGREGDSPAADQVPGRQAWAGGRIRGGDHVPRATAPRVPDPAACPGRHLVPGRRRHLAVGGATGHASR